MTKSGKENTSMHMAILSSLGHILMSWSSSSMADLKREGYKDMVKLNTLVETAMLACSRMEREVSNMRRKAITCVPVGILPISFAAIV